MYPRMIKKIICQGKWLEELVCIHFYKCKFHPWPKKLQVYISGLQKWPTNESFLSFIFKFNPGYKPMNFIAAFSSKLWQGKLFYNITQCHLYGASYEFDIRKNLLYSEELVYFSTYLRVIYMVIFPSQTSFPGLTLNFHHAASITLAKNECWKRKSTAW